MTWAEIGEFAAKHWLTVAFGIIAAAGTAAYRQTSNRIKKDRDAGKAVKAGVEALLADRIIQLHNFYADKGYCPIYARKSAETMFKAYHDLGGNGAITDVHEHIKTMPMEKKDA